MKTIIFDFDGTIADNFDFVFEIVNSLAPKYGYETFDRESFAELRQLSLRQITEKYHIGWWNLLRMTLDGRKAMARHLSETKSPEGLADVLVALKRSGYQLAIISSNSERSIRDFLKYNNLGEVFGSVYTSLSIFGKGAMIRKMMHKYHLVPSETIYVGDEVRDIDAAKSADVRIISVTWGYNTAEVLEKNNELIARKPSDLPALITSVFK